MTKSRGLIIEIPVDDVSESQKLKNYDMLTSIQKKSLIPQEIRGSIPRPMEKHAVNSQNIYIVEYITGIMAGSTVHDDQVKDRIIKMLLTSR